jgi:phosphate:Na+ symporter
MSAFSELPAVSRLFISLQNPLLLLLAGTLLTMVVQSSTALTGIIITLAGAGAGGGLISLASAFYIILGANIGTCATAVIASFGATINAKRAALIHVLFNALSAIIFLPLIIVFNRGVIGAFEQVFGSNIAMSIAWFNIILNVATALILLPFVKQLVNLAEKILPERVKSAIV